MKKLILSIFFLLFCQPLYGMEAFLQESRLSKARNAVALISAGTLLERNFHFELAEKCFEKAAQQDASQIVKTDGMYRLGVYAQTRGDLKRAAILMRQVTAQDYDPSLKMQGLLSLGNIHEAQGKTKEAEQYFLEVANQHDNPSKRAIGLMRLGMLHKKLKCLDKAEAFFRQAIDQEDNATVRQEALGELGFLYHTQDRLQEAEDCYKQVADHEWGVADSRGDPENKLSVCVNLGALLLNQKRLEEAQIYLNMAADYGEDFGAQKANLRIKVKALCLLQQLEEQKEALKTEEANEDD